MRKRGGRKRAIGTRAPMLIPMAADDRWSLDFVSDQLTDPKRRASSSPLLGAGIAFGTAILSSVASSIATVKARHLTKRRLKIGTREPGSSAQHGSACPTQARPFGDRGTDQAGRRVGRHDAAGWKHDADRHGRNREFRAILGRGTRNSAVSRPRPQGGKFGRSSILSAEQIAYARQLVDEDNKPVAEVATLLGVHRSRSTGRLVVRSGNGGICAHGVD